MKRNDKQQKENRDRTENREGGRIFTFALYFMLHACRMCSTIKCYKLFIYFSLC